jgi:hypothetical protein
VQPGLFFALFSAKLKNKNNFLCASGPLKIKEILAVPAPQHKLK